MNKKMQHIIYKTEVVSNVRGTKFLVLPYFVKCVECRESVDCVHLGSVNDSEFLCITCWDQNYEDVYYRGEWY